MSNNKTKEKKNKLHSPFMQLTTLRRFGILIVTFLVAYIPENSLPVSRLVRSLIIVALLLVSTFFELASLRLSHARRLIQKGKKEKGWKAFKGVVKTPIVPLSSDEKLFLGTAFIQHSDEPEVGIAYLEKWISKTKSEYNRIRATNAVALGYFRIGNKEKAIELSKDLYEKDYDDVGLLINYSTFLLANGDYEKAFDVIEKGGNNIYILDNLGVYYLVNGMHKDAIKLYREILDNMHPHFVEFYIHAFQSELYYSCKANAREMLRASLSCPRVLTSPFSKEYVERLLKEMENSSGEAKINASVEEVAFGKEWANTQKVYIKPSQEDIDYFHKDPYDEVEVDLDEDNKTDDEVKESENEQNVQNNNAESVDEAIKK